MLLTVFVGVHWPSDVLMGALLGGTVACLVHEVYADWETASKHSRHR